MPVIALTARSRREDRERCLAAGMDDFLAKPIRADDLWAAIERVVSLGSRQSEEGSEEAPSASSLPTADGRLPGCSEPSLLDAQVLLAACGDDPVILRRICEALQARLPEELAAVEAAWRGQDAAPLREAAHKFCGIVAAFSTVAASVAANLEDHAAAGRLEECRPVVERLQTITQELIRQVSGVSIEGLRRQAESVGDPK